MFNIIKVINNKVIIRCMSSESDKKILGFVLKNDGDECESLIERNSPSISHNVSMVSNDDLLEQLNNIQSSQITVMDSLNIGIDSLKLRLDKVNDAIASNRYEELKNLIGKVIENQENKDGCKMIDSDNYINAVSNSVVYYEKQHKSLSDRLVFNRNNEFLDVETLDGFNAQEEYADTISEFVGNIKQLDYDMIEEAIQTKRISAISRDLIKVLIPYFYNNNPSFKKIVDENLVDIFDNVTGNIIGISDYCNLLCIIFPSFINVKTNHFPSILIEMVSVPVESVSCHIMKVDENIEKIIEEKFRESSDKLEVDRGTNNLLRIYNFLGNNRSILLSSCVITGFSTIMYNNPELVLSTFNFMKSLVVGNNSIIETSVTAIKEAPIQELAVKSERIEKPNTGMLKMLYNVDYYYLAFRVLLVGFIGADYIKDNEENKK